MVAEHTHHLDGHRVHRYLALRAPAAEPLPYPGHPNRIMRLPLRWKAIVLGIDDSLGLGGRDSFRGARRGGAADRSRRGENHNRQANRHRSPTRTHCRLHRPSTSRTAPAPQPIGHLVSPHQVSRSCFNYIGRTLHKIPNHSNGGLPRAGLGQSIVATRKAGEARGRPRGHRLEAGLSREEIAGAAHGVKVLRPMRIRLEAAPQSQDEVVDRAIGGI